MGKIRNKPLDEKEVCDKFLELNNSIIGTANYFKVLPKRIKKIIENNNLWYKKKLSPISIKDIIPSDAKAKYDELGTLTKVADFYGVCIETLRQLFIDNNLQYTKSLKYNCDHTFFSKDTEESFYWAGFLAADGGVEKKKPRITIGLKTDDRSHIQKFKNYVKSEAPIYDWIRYDNRPNFITGVYYSSVIRVTSKQMVKDLLEKFNIGPTKSLTYEFPIKLKYHELIRHYIRGLIDGDGWIYNDKNEGDIGLCGTEQSVKFVYDFLREKLNLISGDFGRSQEKLWSMNFGRIDDTQKIIHYLYDNATVWLDRKYEVAMSILENKYTPGKKGNRFKIDKEKLKEMILNKQKIEDIAEYFNCSVVVIRRRLNEFNIIKELRDENNFYYANHNKLFSLISKEQFFKDLEELKYVRYIANKYNVTTCTVENALKICGLNPLKYRIRIYKTTKLNNLPFTEMS